MNQVINTKERVKSNPIFGLFDALNIPAAEQRGQYDLNHSDQLPFKYGSRDEDATSFYEKMGIKVIGRTHKDELFLDVILPEGWKKQSTDHSMWNELVDDKGRVRAMYFYKAAFYDREAFIRAETRYSYNCITYLPHDECGHYEKQMVKVNNPNFQKIDNVEIHANGYMTYQDSNGYTHNSYYNCFYNVPQYIEKEEDVWIPKYKNEYEKRNNTPHYFEITDGKTVIYTTKDKPLMFTRKYRKDRHAAWWKAYTQLEDLIRAEATGYLDTNYPGWNDFTKHWD